MKNQLSRPFSSLPPRIAGGCRQDVEDAYPVARLQLGMFFHNELNPASAIYHDVFSFRIESAFDCDNLADSLSHLIQRHPILRTSFHIAGFHDALQMVHRQARFRLTVEDLREAGPAEQENALVEWIEREKRVPFERTAAPLLRFHVQWNRREGLSIHRKFSPRLPGRLESGGHFDGNIPGLCRCCEAKSGTSFHLRVSLTGISWRWKADRPRRRSRAEFWIGKAGGCKSANAPALAQNDVLRRT